ncbi:MAG: hypothetical protein K9J12_14825 [Melioribacteraceae bacterium]|nr:hypothetical protein [Melioribacteraceae bacterium]MCF8431818.1 hypothetical protein [Melioribacteraceae bacterium]
MKKNHKKRFVRKLTDREILYLEELEKYIQVLKVTMLISLNQHGIETTGRGIRASKIFTRQTLLGMSFRKILPIPSKYKHPEDELWDICSIASLSRNIMEGYISLLFFGIEKVSEEEAELRFFLGQYHRNREWYQIRKRFGENENKLHEFVDGLKAQKQRLKNHPYLSKLTRVQQNKVLQGLEMYKTKEDFENENKVCTRLRGDYQVLSNLIHPLPLSIERMNNESGRGIGSKHDITYCILSLVIARRYLAASTIGFSDFFYSYIGKKFEKDLNTIRSFTLPED